ncbi:MucR family transcriptional regulator [Motilibacter rhizosphaerae]|uniref:MucR family transcriptional regulator n=1 Tax=Motilibacter rhizosphaerae TaxID=598652 RepID=UPI00102B45F1
MEPASGTAYGRLATADGGEAVLCHECGSPYRFLSSHVRQAHGLTADDYRERWGLNRTTPLASPALLAARANEGHRRYRLPAVREGLARGQALARSGELLQLSHEAQPAGSARAERRAQTLETTALTRRSTARSASRRLEATLTALGFDSFPAYWRQRYDVEGLSMLRIRAELGVGGETLTRLLETHQVATRRRPGGAGPARARWGRPAAR